MKKKTKVQKIQQDKPKGKSKYALKFVERGRIARKLGVNPIYPVIWDAQAENEDDPKWDELT